MQTSAGGTSSADAAALNDRDAYVRLAAIKAIAASPEQLDHLALRLLACFGAATLLVP